MKFLSTKEAAERWDISQRRVSILASQGRIKGAKMVANRWLIPEDAPKPSDTRLGIEKSTLDPNERYVFPFLLSCINSEEQIAAFTPEEKELYKLCMVYESGNFKYARQLAEKLLGSGNRYIRIGALYHLPVICMYLRDFKSTDKYFILFNTEIVNVPRHRKELFLIRDALDSELVSASDYKVPFNLASLQEYPDELIPMISSLLLFSNLTKVTLAESRVDLAPFELLCKMIESNGYFFPALLTHAYLAACYGMNRISDKELYHLKRAIDIGLEHNVFFTLAYTAALLPDTLSTILKDYPYELAQKFRKFAETFIFSRSEYARYRGTAPGVEKISVDEYKLVSCCLKSYSIEKMADVFSLSVSGMKKRLARLYEKLGVNNKNEIATVYLRSIIDWKKV